MTMQTDRQDVTDVLARYCRAIDTKDWDLLASCFTSDCRTRYQGRPFDGVERLTDVMRRLHDPLDASLHRLTNVEVDLDGDTATARAYVDALLVRTDHRDGALHQVAGFYTDQLVRSRNGWLISTRVFEPVWITERGALPAPSDDTRAVLHRVPPGGSQAAP